MGLGSRDIFFWGGESLGFEICFGSRSIFFRAEGLGLEIYHVYLSFFWGGGREKGEEVSKGKCFFWGQGLYNIFFNVCVCVRYSGEW